MAEQVLKIRARWLHSGIKIIAGSKLRRASVGSILAGVLGQALLIVTGILTARILGVEDRGNLAILTAFVLSIAVVGSGGIPQATIYFISQTKRIKEIFQRIKPLIAIQSIGLVIIHAVVVYIYVSDKGYTFQTAAYYTLFAIPGFIIQWYGMSLLQSQERYRIFNILRVLPLLAYTIILILLFNSDRGKITNIALIWSLSNLFIGSIIFIISNFGIKERVLINKKEPLPSRKEIAIFGIKGLFGWASPLDSFRVDILIGAVILSPHAIGLYVVGQAFTNLPKIISNSMGMIAYPTISNKKEYQDIRRNFLGFVLFTSALSTIIFLFLYTLIPFLVKLLFGNAFIGAIPIARILIFGALLVSIRTIIVECLRGMGRPEYSSYSEIVIYPWLALSIPILILPFGVNGMAVSVVIGQLFSLTVALILSYKTFYYL
ncbi:hypothetical protein D3OALGA1CA_1436 [Olavius algarvensis associated proteobacterium Delta 3]|nr:hypothetical protein D3OALGB2SA_884 [Olavius algarvensis associated proteobacterium Delta 3]CAB5101169.1 hypothetical protein D3OALGA1CA_1436 [Olavius algarvensis associated proteobacterium Delta 3]